MELEALVSRLPLPRSSAAKSRDTRVLASSCVSNESTQNGTKRARPSMTNKLDSLFTNVSFVRLAWSSGRRRLSKPSFPRSIDRSRGETASVHYSRTDATPIKSAIAANERHYPIGCNRFPASLRRVAVADQVEEEEEGTRGLRRGISCLREVLRSTDQTTLRVIGSCYLEIDEPRLLTG